MERQLAAILAADVVGYSRLIREDEASTLTNTWSARRSAPERLPSVKCLGSLHR